MPEKPALIQYWKNTLAMDYRDNRGLDLSTRVRVRSVHWADVMYESPASASQIAENAELSLESAGTLELDDLHISSVDDSFLSGLGRELDFAADDIANADMPPVPENTDLAEAAAEAIPLPWFLKKRLMRLFVRDTHHYLFNIKHSPRHGETYDVRDEIRGRFVAELDAAKEDGPIVLLTHSMGTVIAYDCLKNLKSCPEVRHLMTVGSPLGLSEVQAKLDPGYSRHDGFPHERVDFRWVNVFDPLDIVSRADAYLRSDYLKNWGEMVEDVRQSNGGLWTHPVKSYFRQKKLRDSLRELI
ncbi:pimeloyl-ACP methyl ester carboxylesterase [Labrenzia sp. EL_13]|nr:pimeloyl-ACP methyl ester carboxylesterase [Labrenzia sp. EL_13]